MPRSRLIRALAALIVAALALGVSYDRLIGTGSSGNTSTASSTSTTTTGTTTRSVTHATTTHPGRVVPVLTRDRLEHIEQRHWPGSSATGAGKFAAGITPASLEAMIDEAVLHGQARADTQGRPGTVYEYDFGHPIGIDIDGRPTSRIRVVVGTDNHVITAFPV